MHDANLIGTIAVGFVLALAFGFVAARLHLPPLVGYLVAGIFAGPFTPGLHADPAMAGQLAEVGVILLMFGVGLHFSVADLMAVRSLAVPGAIVQILSSTALGFLLALGLGWGAGAGLVFGLSLSVASTVVLLRALEDGNRLDTASGRVAVGWLIVEDLAMVVALVLLPALSGALGGHQAGVAAGPAIPADIGAIAIEIAMTLAKVAAFVAVALVLGPKLVPRLLGEVARTGSRELFTLSVLAIALGIGVGSAKVFGVSYALGAFFAGVILAETHFSHRAAAESLPLQDAFSVLFFVSVGMLFDPSVLWREPAALVATLGIVIIGKGLIAFLLALALRYPVSLGITLAASLSQIGEFSFILAALGLDLGLLPAEARDLVLGAAILSIALNKVVMQGSDRLAGWAAARYSEFGTAHLTALEDTLAANRERADERERQRALRIDTLLATFPLLENVSPADREELLLLFHAKNAGPGARLIRRGDRPDGMYFITAGRVEVDIPAGGRAVLEAGTLFGEMSLLDGTRRTANVTALDYCQFLVLERRDFDLFMARHPEVYAAVRGLAEERSAMNSQAEAAMP